MQCMMGHRWKMREEIGGEGGHSEELGLSSVFVLMGLRRVWDGALGGKNVPDKGWELRRVHWEAVCACLMVEGPFFISLLASLPIATLTWWVDSEHFLGSQETSVCHWGNRSVSTCVAEGKAHGLELDLSLKLSVTNCMSLGDSGPRRVQFYCL